MFKKALADLKTSGKHGFRISCECCSLYYRHHPAPLRGSDRKKLKLRVLQTYPAIEASDGDLLVPDGLQAQKFSTHHEKPGVGPLLSP